VTGSSSAINLGTIGASAGIPTLNVADIPAEIRTGGPRAMQAYSEGLAFEDMLVNELTQQLSNTMFAGAQQPDAGSDPTEATGGGSLGAYAAFMPQALTTSIMSAGGLGVAQQIAEALDPALTRPTKGAGG